MPSPRKPRGRGARGFRALVGRTVVAVDDRAANVVTLTLDTGARLTLEAEALSSAVPIPILSLAPAPAEAAR